MIKNYSEEKTELKEPRKDVVDFILNYSKALHVNKSSKVKSFIILN
nr:hypothetical protein [uncultured Flavobacterium sp.]